MTSTALLTGVTGFIGGKLAARLMAEGWLVHALVRGASDVADVPVGVALHRYDGDVSALTGMVETIRPDIVFHLASLYLAEHKPKHVDALVASNILYPAQLAEAMTATGCLRLVNTGTAWQHYGTDGYDPVNLYAATKQACVDLLRFYHEARGLSVVTLELFDTYGAGDKRRKLVQLLVDAASSGEPLGMSPGEQVVDMTHVDDVVEAFVLAAAILSSADAPFARTYRLSGERMSVRALVDVVAGALGRPIAATFGSLPYRKREVMMPVEAGDDDRLPGWRVARSVHSAVVDLARGSLATGA